jgi:hypothetical protein
MERSRFLAILALASALLLAAACYPGSGPVFNPLNGSGNLVTKEYDLNGFDKIEISGAFRARVSQGDAFRVSITVDDNIAPQLKVEKRGDTLHVGLLPGTTLMGGTLRADIAMPVLVGANVSGAADTELGSFSSSKRGTFESSGAARLHGTIDCGGARVEATGAGSVELAGQAGDMEVEVSGAGTALLKEFLAEDVKIDASGGGRAEVSVAGSLTGEASGGARVTYFGDPNTVRVNTSGGATVRGG